MSHHPSLAWPAGEPTELEWSARELSALADRVNTDAVTWNSPHRHTTWSGMASRSNARAVVAMRVRCADLAEPLRTAAQLTWVIANALRHAQAQIAALARHLERVEWEATQSMRRASVADQDARAQEIRALVDPLHLPAARSTRQAATTLASVAHRDESERQVLLLTSIRDAASIVADFDSVDRSTASAIDLLVREPATPFDDTTWPITAFGHLDLLERPPSTTTQLGRRQADRQLLVWNPTGDGLIVEVFGDLSAAQHIAVLVPGVMNTMDNFDVMVAERAKSLYESSLSFDPSVAVVAWLGYDTPELLNGISKQRARDHEDRLRSFVASLPSAHVTIVAHSYGSVLAGEAALVNLPVDDLVMIGSPGTSLETANDARLAPGGQVWAGVSDTDVIGRTGWGSLLCPEVIGGSALSVPWLLTPSYPASLWSPSCKTDADGDVLGLSHGVNPAHEDFGATEILTDGVSGHSSYLDPGTASLEAIASIVTDQHESQR